MRLLALTLYTAQLHALVAFYRDILGLPCTETPDAATFQAGATAVIFRENPDFNGVYHFAFNIPCNRIRAAMAWLEDRGVALIRDAAGHSCQDFVNWNAEATYFFDPAGNIVEFIARRDLHNSSEQPFGPEALLAVSEIGIATSDVLAWNARAARDYGVLPFDKSRPGPDFSPLGADTGLFIVVPEGRKWFLTDIPATRNPLEVEFENAAGQRFALREP